MNTSQDYQWAELVKEVEGAAYYERPVQYEFSNGRTFKEQQDSGIYEQQGD